MSDSSKAERGAYVLQREYSAESLREFSRSLMSTSASSTSAPPVSSTTDDDQHGVLNVSTTSVPLGAASVVTPEAESLSLPMMNAAGTRVVDADNADRPSCVSQDHDAEATTTVVGAFAEIDIDQEFSKLIPPPSEEELVQLEGSILAVKRCLDPLIVWADGPRRILLDGHNRLKICRRHSLAYNVEAIDLQDREAALQWILEHQLGRRNLTPEAYAYLRGKLYNSTKSQGARRDLTSGHNAQKSTTAQNIAAQYKVDEKTIRRDGDFAEHLDQLAAEGSADIKSAVLARDAKITRNDVDRLRKLEASTRKDILTQVLAGGVAAKLIRTAKRATSAGGDTQSKITVQGATSSAEKRGDGTKATKPSPSTTGSPSAAKSRATGRQDDNAAKHLDRDPVDAVFSALDVVVQALERLPPGAIKPDRLLIIKERLRQINSSMKAHS